MYSRYFTVTLLIMAFASNVRADIPHVGPGPRPPRPLPMPHDFRPPPVAPRLVVSRDSSNTTAQLILPASLVAGLKPAVGPRFAAMAPNILVGLALAGSLIAGALWLARMPRAKYVVASVLPLLGFAQIAAAVQAQPAKLETPRGIVETGKVRISRDANALQIRLILPKQVVATK